MKEGRKEEGKGPSCPFTLPCGVAFSSGTAPPRWAAIGVATCVGPLPPLRLPRPPTPL